MLNEFIATYGMEILFTIVTAVAGYIGIAIKTVYQKYVNDKTKEKVVHTVVKAVEQLYSGLDGSERYYEAIKNIRLMLDEKGIPITELEIEMLIEAAVKEMNENSGYLLFDETQEAAEETGGN